jgi:hypothetical protein
MADAPTFLQLFSRYIPATEVLLKEFPCSLQGYRVAGTLYISHGFVCYFAPQPVYIVIPIKTITLLQQGAPFCLVVVQPERTSQFVMEPSHVETAYNTIQGLLGAPGTCAHCGRFSIQTCANCTATKKLLIQQVSSLLTAGGTTFQ